jgi:hypothetical protein
LVSHYKNYCTVLKLYSSPDFRSTYDDYCRWHAYYLNGIIYLDTFQFFCNFYESVIKYFIRSCLVGST